VDFERRELRDIFLARERRLLFVKEDGRAFRFI
jgi:hypothetical protein